MPRPTRPEAAPPPLLRSPPFPWIAAERAAVSVAAPPAAPPAPDAIGPLFALIRAARVGGRCWDADDPWPQLLSGEAIRASGDDERAALAVIAGAPLVLIADGRFARGDDTAEARRARVAALLLGTRYRDPFTGAATDIARAVATLADWRRQLDANHRIAAAAGFAWWKRREVRRLLWAPRPRPLHFHRREAGAVAAAARGGGALAVWPSRVSPSLTARATAGAVPIVQVEDGFIRSVGLGSDLVPPFSIVVDALGIHYDPAGPSELEQLLEHAPFPPELLARAAGLRAAVVAAGIGKYGAGLAGDGAPPRAGRRVVLVPGQVEDDRSVLSGGGGMTNLQLLARARAAEPQAELWFRPHPDVDAGHRRGTVADGDALLHADRVVRGGSMAAMLDRVDAVHTLTSLTGFEALVKGREVHTHGVPFYAGWGLTRDHGPVPARRTRRLALDELVAGVLILYPRYLDPVTGLPCPPELLVERIARGEAGRAGLLTALRRVQGKVMRRLG